MGLGGNLNCKISIYFFYIMFRKTTVYATWFTRKLSCLGQDEDVMIFMAYKGVRGPYLTNTVCVSKIAIYSWLEPKLQQRKQGHFFEVNVQLSSLLSEKVVSYNVLFHYYLSPKATHETTDKRNVFCICREMPHP